MTLSIFSERFLPIILATLAGFLAFRFQLRMPANEVGSLLSAAISLGAVFAGFLAGAVAILYALPKDGGIKSFINSGYLKEIQQYIQSGIITSIAFCSISLLGFFPIATDNPQAFPAIWIWSGSLSLFSFARIGYILIKLLPIVYQ